MKRIVIEKEEQEIINKKYKGITKAVKTIQPEEHKTKGKIVYGVNKTKLILK